MERGSGSEGVGESGCMGMGERMVAGCGESECGTVVALVERRGLGASATGLGSVLSNYLFF